MAFTSACTWTYQRLSATSSATYFLPLLKISFELRHDKQDKAGTVPIYVVACFDGLRLRCSTKERCEPRPWNEKEQEFRRSFPGYTSANLGLQALVRRLEDKYREQRANASRPFED